jgi:putative ABC transport system permease protein
MMVFKLAMGAFASISLIVGGIGIMNVLLAAVAERTREIGIRKATGARNRDILQQFLAESIAITSVGSALGVVVGISGALLVTWVMRVRTDAPVYAAVTLQTMAICALIAVAIGAVFGMVPALRAARLSPIDAIRHD